MACDDCDEWFHQLCVGATAQAVEEEDTEFHCGMLQGMTDYYDHAARATQSTTSGENIDYSSKN